MTVNGLFGLAILVGLAASFTDLRTRQIPNWIPVAALAGGLAGNAVLSGWPGFGSALAGAALGFGVFYLRYWLLGLGGGDVKLMAGFGAILGWQHVWLAIVLSGALGGLLALAALVYWNMREPAGGAWRRAIPYAPAISLGSFLALIDRLPG